MGNDWQRKWGNVRSFLGNATGGLRGGSNLASWVVAGTLAYFLWIKPSQDLKRQQEVNFQLSINSYEFPFLLEAIKSLEVRPGYRFNT